MAAESWRDAISEWSDGPGTWTIPEGERAFARYGKTHMYGADKFVGKYTAFLPDGTKNRQERLDIIMERRMAVGIYEENEHGTAVIQHCEYSHLIPYVISWRSYLRASVSAGIMLNVTY
jgi:hypothetical protein